VFSEAEIRQSFAAFGKLGQDRVQCDERGLFYVQPEANCIDLEYPPKLERLPFFARLLAGLGYDDADFAGASLWFTEWGVWNPYDEAIGYRIVEGMNQSAGQPKSFEVAPGHIFRADELQSAVGMLMQPMVFGWDAYYLPQWSFGCEEFFLYVSHDSFVTVVTRTTAFYEKAFRILEELQLQPEAAPEPRRHRFCRARVG
jgi:hypothetical protein